MMDLFVFAAVLSRVNTTLQSAPSRGGLEKADSAHWGLKEMDILNVFSGQVHRRTQIGFQKIDDNDDESVKSLAEDVLTHESYRWDNL